MPNETKTTTEATDPRDAHIKELEGLLAERVEDIEALTEDLKGADGKIAELEKAAKKSSRMQLPAGDYVSLGGVIHPVTATFRADQTFAEVRKGHCDEGVTLVAIAKLH